LRSVHATHSGQCKVCEEGMERPPLKGSNHDRCFWLGRAPHTDGAPSEGSVAGPALPLAPDRFPFLLLLLPWCGRWPVWGSPASAAAASSALLSYFLVRARSSTGP
jgi:hypothetical protein